MKERRLRKIVNASKERDILLRMISLFTHNEDYFGRLGFYDRCGADHLSTADKVILVLEERLKETEDYLRYLIYNNNGKDKDERKRT